MTVLFAHSIARYCCLLVNEFVWGNRGAAALRTDFLLDDVMAGLVSSGAGEDKFGNAQRPAEPARIP